MKESEAKEEGTGDDGVRVRWKEGRTDGRTDAGGGGTTIDRCLIPDTYILLYIIYAPSILLSFLARGVRKAGRDGRKKGMGRVCK